MEPALSPALRNGEWVQRAVLDQYRAQGIRPGERISIPYAKLAEYCPDILFEFVIACGFQSFHVISASIEKAAELDLIGMSERTGKRRAHEYWLLPNHPAVRAEWTKQGNAKLKLVRSTN
jgi:hypothetical protein